MNKMRLYIVLLVFAFSCILFTPRVLGQKSLHSDSIDVLHYGITLDITDFANQTISGNTELKIKPKVNNLHNVELDLLAFFIDSITVNGAVLPVWNYDDTLLSLPLLQPANVSDTLTVTVYYYGHPQQDPGASAWGGFKWSGNSAYNLGVGFAAIPHNFGRCWFPCVDDFIDRATYDFYISVDGALNHFAVCNGTFIESETNHCTFKKLCHWQLKDEIPTYLASVAVDQYVAVKDTFIGLLGPIPIQIYTRPADSLKAVNSFVNLKNILSLFESKFGPYRWERVGYVGVDFDAGAMEHATTVAFPNLCFTGNTAYEELYTHELSHSWFGNLVTCHSAEDMWINEGWASFSEMVYEEAFFGRDYFITNKRSKLNKVLRYNQIEEGGFVTLNMVPENITYGSSSYDKGALVVQSLRSYIGDSLFYATVKDMMETFKFKDITSEQMQHYLTNRTGINMTGFFDNWVMSPGFPHYSIDSVQIVPNGINFDVNVYSKEKLRGRTGYSADNRVEVTFVDSSWNMSTKTVQWSGETGLTTFTLPFRPVCSMMDLYEKTDDATNDQYKTIKSSGTYIFDQTYFTGIVNNVTDSSFVRVEHNWVAPDDFKTPIPGVLISRERYWKVDVIFSPDFVMKGKFYYNKTTSSSNGYLDIQLLTNVADSMVLLYREGAWDDWRIVPTTRTGNNYYGSIYTDTIHKGEYALGIRNWALYQGVGSLYNKSNNEIRLLPNPASQTCTIKCNFEPGDEVKVIDIKGRVMFVGISNRQEEQMSLKLEDYNSGLYLVQVTRKDGKSICGRLLVE